MTKLTESEYESEQDLFRQAAIQGLDEGMKDFAARHFRRNPHSRIEGIRDAALPAFFVQVDKAFDDALDRYGVTVSE